MCILLPADRCSGMNYTDGAELYMQVGVGSRYLHARYVRYMDETFTVSLTYPNMFTVPNFCVQTWTTWTIQPASLMDDE